MDITFLGKLAGEPRNNTFTSFNATARQVPPFHVAMFYKKHFAICIDHNGTSTKCRVAQKALITTAEALQK